MHLLAPDGGQAPPRRTKKRHKTRPRRAIGKRPPAPGCETQAGHSPKRAVEGPLECGIALGSPRYHSPCSELDRGAEQEAQEQVLAGLRVLSGEAPLRTLERYGHHDPKDAPRQGATTGMVQEGPSDQQTEPASLRRLRARQTARDRSTW